MGEISWVIQGTVRYSS